MSPVGRGGGRRRKGRMQSVGDLVGQVLGDLGLDGVAQAHEIGSQWAEIVGPQIASHCRPLGIRGPVLELEVDSPVWSQQLQLRKTDLLRRLAERLGPGVQSELRFQVGYSRRR